MATNQPVSQLNGLPMLETVLVGTPPIVLTSPQRAADDQARKWASVEEHIAAWTPATGEPDERTDADGYRLPARKAVRLALEIAARLCQGGVTSPEWVASDGNGGIDFEWRSGDHAETLSINARGEMELMEFGNSKLIARKPATFAPPAR